MPRAIWSGAISFGLVNVPVKLVTAVSPKEVRFHMLHDADGARIHQKRVCSADGEEVPWEHIAKGYEFARGRYVMVTREALEALDPEATHTIDIEDFVDLSEIDPVYYQSTYYLVPDRGAAKPYALLHAAMSKSGKVGIARMVMRTKQYLCALRPVGRAIAVSTMQYADEIIPANDLDGLPSASTKPAERELRLAQQLIDSLSHSFNPARYNDEYREKLLHVLKQKAQGKEIVVEERAERPAEVVNLLDALQQSLAGSKKKEERPREGRAPSVRKAAPRRRAASRAATRPRRSRPAA